MSTPIIPNSMLNTPITLDLAGMVNNVLATCKTVIQGVQQGITYCGHKVVWVVSTAYDYVSPWLMGMIGKTREVWGHLLPYFTIVMQFLSTNTGIGLVLFGASVVLIIASHTLANRPSVEDQGTASQTIKISQVLVTMLAIVTATASGVFFADAIPRIVVISPV